MLKALQKFFFMFCLRQPDKRALLATTTTSICFCVVSRQKAYISKGVGGRRKRTFSFLNEFSDAFRAKEKLFALAALTERDFE